MFEEIYFQKNCKIIRSEACLMFIVELFIIKFENITILRDKNLVGMKNKFVENNFIVQKYILTNNKMNKLL